MLPNTNRISHAIDEGLWGTAGPHAVELCRIPDSLNEERGNLNWVGRWAGSTRRISDVALVIGTVEIHTVPARREDDLRADTAKAWMVWKLIRIRAR